MPKQKKKIELKFNPHLPNDFHRAAKWSGGRIFRNKKKYTRKGKPDYSEV